MTELTDEQCVEFRRLPMSFNDMVRAIYKAGRESMREEAMEACEKQSTYDEYDPGATFSNVIKELP